MIPCRYIYAALAALGMIICYALKVNINIAIVSMVNHTAIRLEENAYNNSGSNQSESGLKSRSFESIALRGGDEDDEQLVEDGPLLWSHRLQGIIISSYFWGYLVGQYPGGRLSEVFSAKWMFYIGGSMNIVGTLLIPLAAYIHYSIVIVIRVLQGFGGGFTFPAAHVLLSRWAPPNERSVISTLVYTGTALGTVISMLLTGTIAARINWESAFYIMGGCCLPWMILWPLLIYDRPKQHRLIKEKELKLLTETLGETEGKAKAPVPWKSISKSMPVYALAIAHMTTGWTWYMVLTGMPLFMHMVLHFKIQENAILTAIPFFSLWVFSLLYGKLIDVLIAKNKLSVTWARKTSTIIATVIPIACFVIMCYIGEQKVIAVTLMTVAVTSIGAIFSGFILNHIDLAVHFAGTLMAISNTLATVGGIVVPLFVGWLTQADPTIGSWRIIFWITAAMNALQLITYTLFATGKEQQWNSINPKDSESESKKE